MHFYLYFTFIEKKRKYIEYTFRHFGILIQLPDIFIYLCLKYEYV